MAEGVLKNIATYRGTPSSLLYGVATAPYFYLPSETASSETATMDQILTGLENSLLTETEPYFAARKAYTTADATGATHKSLADYYGIKSLGYEGGPDLGQSSANGTAKIAANRDARMGGMVKSELTQWFGCGNDLFMYFTLSSQWDRWGYWGLTNDPTNLSGAKYSAARDIAQTARSNLTTCR
jgi:hypothetical protein